ncbi:hypothetical protein CWS01_11575 [Niallia nealsonii]|uniref:Uncharacterized protein n=1 Tax=Niallia nealsonii TaxID=115979 RepID=A0A2N0Z284_9BACI|nr:hypothetical protein CWS01_11575 [Niallia nealsonii]
MIVNATIVEGFFYAFKQKNPVGKMKKHSNRARMMKKLYNRRYSNRRVKLIIRLFFNGSKAY